MYESSFILGMNIKHYQQLLNVFDADDARRPTVNKLLADAQTEFSLAVVDEKAGRGTRWNHPS